MSKVAERFLKYVSFDTQSKDEEEQVPSTEKQLVLAKELVKELEEMGASDVRLSEHGYVYATIEANTEKNVPSLGFVAHMDTAPAMSGRDVKARIVEKYAGGDIVLNEEKNIVMTVKDFPFMADCEGRDLIVTDGTTLLGGDDKAGVAEIMTMAAWLLAHPEIPHGTIRIGFTPDEEVGRGADFFDVEGFGADVAYTVDGGPLGELEYENFNAASGKVYIHGVGIHPGGAKNKMKSALLIGMEFQSLLPAFENPMYTDGYEGFFHLDQFAGDVEYAKMDYLIRDHDMDKFTQKKELFASAAEFLNKKYGEGTVELKIKDSYYNMKEKIEPYKYLIDIAKEAMEEVGITPEVSPIRGGTDGARLSYPVQSMEKVVELLLTIVRKFEKIEK